MSFTAEADPGAESAAPAPFPGNSEDKRQEDDLGQGPPAFVELNMEEKTDDEGVDSIKTSVESLKEANDNNSNNNSEQTGWYYVTLILAVCFHPFPNTV